ncbi:unnamed protein product [Adineta steineri]|uniref:Uncharacterized protein n=1 Tax=Adineta steineri TaxID=433720 RepID=A0A819H5W5_9BILA|nr:unnamed protein product [Adineta steineri]
MIGQHYLKPLKNTSRKISGVLLCIGPVHTKRQGTRHSYHNLYCSVLDILTSDEVLNFNLVAYHRTLDELTDESTLKETNFEVIVADTMVMEQSIYANYKQGNISLDEYGKKYTEFVRSWSEASLNSALDTSREEKEKAKIIEEVYAEFERRTKSNEGLKLMELYSNHVHYVILRRM